MGLQEEKDKSESEYRQFIMIKTSCVFSILACAESLLKRLTIIAACSTCNLTTGREANILFKPRCRVFYQEKKHCIPSIVNYG